MAMFALSGGNIVLARDLASADDGTKTYTLTALGGGGKSVSATGTVVISAAGSIPILVTIATPTVPLLDSATAGAIISGYSVQTTDGKPFTGTMSITGPA